MPEKKPSLKEKIKQMSWVQKGVILGIVFLLVGGFSVFAFEQYKYESTDDAYVGAYSTLLAPEVPALVTQVFVQENQRVKAGQILAQLDTKDYLAALQSAQASLGALAATLKDRELDYRRAESLYKGGAMTKQQFDHALASYEEILSQVDGARAQVSQAKLNLGYTSIRAPIDGQIAKRSVDVGMYVSAGTALFGFIPFDERWVDANFKETQLASVRIGKKVEVQVDAVPGRTFEGVVESISPATGATFTLMPPDNATGNFTKVVQRVPVRIVLKNLKEEDFPLLQAGLSADVSVLKHSKVEPVPARPSPVFLSEQNNLVQKNDLTTPERGDQAGVSGD
jgi:membrane fusion protein (multidrug efflux system)